MDFEYKVIPAPIKGRKARGIRKPDDRFALAIQECMNEQAQMGWEFVRSETLPNTERTGLTRRSTTERSLLVFRREKALPEPKSSLEATLREVEKPKPAPAPAPVVEPEVLDPAPVAQPAVPVVAETVVPMEAPKVAEPVARAEPAPAPAPPVDQPVKRVAVMDESSFPDPRGPSTPKAESQALFSKDTARPAKSAKPNALPAALRSRASQSQDGKKA